MIVAVDSTRQLLTNRTSTLALDGTYREVHLLVGFVNGRHQAFEPRSIRQEKIRNTGHTRFLRDKYGLFSRITKIAEEPVYD
jgi:hypothetical protein